MPTYLFQLGHQPLLSAAEIRAVLSLNKIKIIASAVNNHFFEITTDSPLNITSVNHQLGGTVKIMELLTDGRNNNDSLAAYLTTAIPEGKINFSLSGPDAARRAIALKKELKNRGRAVRYIEIKNTATILHNNLVENGTDFNLHGDRIFITRAIQPLEAFAARDYGRPGVDSKSGMLPPKLARLMINLAGVTPDRTLLDPFCGSGTVLVEAADLGLTKLIGSDISERAVQDTAKNLTWYAEGRGRQLAPKLFVADVHTLGQKLQPKSVDAIVSEPYLGKPRHGRETHTELTHTARELRLLYEAAFDVFAKILSPGGVVVFIIPEFYVGSDTVTIDCLSHIKKLGFKVVPLDTSGESLLYRRPDQHVGRRIWKFTK